MSVPAVTKFPRSLSALVAIVVWIAPLSAAADHLGIVPGDTDADGIPGTVELHFGLDPNSAVDATGDVDSDGFSNIVEFRQGSDIGNPEDPIVPLQNPHQKVIGLDTGSVSTSQEQFAVAAALDGSTAVLGSIAQRAYVFVRSAGVWTEQAVLQPTPLPPSWSAFGLHVAISGDTIAIAAPSDNAFGFGSGATYVFTRSGATWSQEAKITSPEASLLDHFGSGIALDGDTLAVPAPGEDTGLSNSGRIYVFTRSGTTWSLEASLDASDEAVDDQIGAPLALDGDTLLVAAINKSEVRGAAYVFTRTGTTWSEQAKLTASDALAGDRFGVGLALDGDTAIIGADLADDDGPNAGTAYVFQRTGIVWSEQDELTPSEPWPSGFFGRFISLSGDGALFGAPYNPPWGAAFQFTRNAGVFSEVSKLTSRDPSFFVGDNVAIDGDHLVLGAIFDESTGDGDGAAYFYETDLDADGVSDLDEVGPGTDPRDADSDDDGLLDGFEILFGFDPLAGGDGAVDTDVDGLTNLEEQMVGTNPKVFDTDGDGVGDGAEVASGRDPLNPTQNLPAASGWVRVLLIACVGLVGWTSAARRTR